MEFLQQYGSDSDSDTSCGPLPPAAEAAEAAEPPPPTQPTTKKQRIRGKNRVYGDIWKSVEVDPPLNPIPLLTTAAKLFCRNMPSIMVVFSSRETVTSCPQRNLENRICLHDRRLPNEIRYVPG
jgi:hypothetical protein